jgi:hypothetical protein
MDLKVDSHNQFEGNISIHIQKMMKTMKNLIRTADNLTNIVTGYKFKSMQVYIITTTHICLVGRK